MAHDLNSDSHWHEPTGLTKKAGLGTFKKPPMPYDVFMEEQEIPIVRAVGVSKVQNLPLGNGVLTDNMQIVRIDYQGDKATLTLDGYTSLYDEIKKITR